MNISDQLQKMLSLAREAAQPQLTESALRERFGVPDHWPLRPGAVWRARWDDVVLLVLLVGAPTTTTVTAMPVTFDDTGADIDTLLVPASAARGGRLAVWRMLRRDLSIAVLDRPVDELAPAVVAWTTGGPAPDNAQTGGSMASSTAPRSPVRADLEDDLDVLMTVAPAPASVPSAPAASQSRDRLSPSDEEYAALMDRLGVGLPAVLDLVDGKRQPSPEEEAALLEIVGRIPEVAAPPAELVIEMWHPRWKATVLDLARRSALNEAKARVSMASGAFALAARQTGDQTPDWRERLARWADAEGLMRW